MLTISIRHGELYYRAQVTPRWAEEHDNGAIISCGLSVPADLSERSLAWLLSRKRAVEITKEQWNHSGCQSQCVLRGDATCRW